MQNSSHCPVVFFSNIGDHAYRENDFKPYFNNATFIDASLPTPSAANVNTSVLAHSDNVWL